MRFELPILKPTGALRITARLDDQKEWIVFLEIARTLPGMVREIPKKKGGKKYDWEKKIIFRLDLEELAGLSYFLTHFASMESPHTIYHQSPDRKSKTITIRKGEKGLPVLKADFEKQEVVLTLSRENVFLITRGLGTLTEKILWKTPV